MSIDFDKDLGYSLRLLSRPPWMRDVGSLNKNDRQEIIQRVIDAFNFSGVEHIYTKKLRERVIITGTLPSGKKPRCSVDFTGLGLPDIDCTHIDLSSFF